MAKSKKALESIVGLEDVDSKYYGAYIIEENSKTYKIWKIEPTAKPISIEGLEEVEMYMSKNFKDGKHMWKVCDAYTGMLLFSSKDDISKSNALGDFKLHLKKKKITKEKLVERILLRVNKYGLSPRFRS